MTLTQKNRLKLTSTEHDLLIRLCYHAARLYNVGLYSVRQHYFEHQHYLPYKENYHLCKTNENYGLLLTDSGQQVLRLVERDMKSFFGLLREKKKGTYDQEVRLPRYKPKEGVMPLTVQGRSARIREGRVLIGFSKGFKRQYQPSLSWLSFPLPKHIEVVKLQEVRIRPLFDGKAFDIEYVYHKQIEPPTLDPTRHLSLDLGLDNFVTALDSTSGRSFILCGRFIKSRNQRYNKNKARLQSIKDQQGYSHVTHRMFRLFSKRGHQVNHFLNLAVKYIVDYCVTHNIGTLVVGEFEGIKQGITLGRRNNQNFVSIPYHRFKQKLASKCQQMGIKLEPQEESYTSKTSFLDGEEPEKQTQYVGKRVKRGLFQTARDLLVNADVNGAGQILHKFLKSKHRLEELNFERVCRGFVNNPTRVKLV